MELKRAATLAVGGGALAAWIAAAASSGNPDRRSVPTFEPSPIDARGATLAMEIERLNDRLRPTATPRASRNLFQFTAGRRKPATAVAAAPEPGTSELPAPAAPALRLIGIAEDAGPEGPVRTAIVSVADHVVLVKQGDAVMSRYRAVTIGADAIELLDTSGGAPLRLVLK